MPHVPTLILAASALLAGPAAAEPPRVQAATAYVKQAKDVQSYRYVYYPVQQLYYSTEQQIWFWRNGSSWNFGVHLPEHFRARMGTGLPLRLTTTRPFLHHDYVEHHYGRPWRKSHEDDRVHADEDSLPTREAKAERSDQG